MTDPFELKRAAIRLRDQYRALNELKMTPPRSTTARKMKPTFGPQSCIPDGDWALNIELLLVDEGDDDNSNHEAPSGLFNMVVDAQRYIHNKTIQNKDGHRLANFVALHSGAIANQFPAADDLLELIIEQTAYIARHIEKRVGAPLPRAEARHNSTVICALLAQQGVSVTPDLLRKWAERGKLTVAHRDGRNGYLLSEVFSVALSSTR
ncbi:hypothetical protein [Corynebacterium lujinxingii]|uniref:Uncharacterized protein n=1 Tax=Corynebacterium lujinxingii TaxID=2763010 RepID=A0A7H0K0R8_9CORY|nr:hypothetical protein [Corynebacterium lujinxingii]MBC3179370.1 hypothetical protein [Corynebacterium lujinxingii]NNO11480.1 hypothetical protein [Corynebacterium lujinxingii]QNP90884.1 hypothetical protein IAU68_03720 [Corynebacterium lujinxingii]